MRKALRRTISVVSVVVLLASLALLPTLALPSESDLTATTGGDTQPRGLFWNIADYYVANGTFGDPSAIAVGSNKNLALSNIDQDTMFGDSPWRGEYLLSDDTFGAMNTAWARLQNNSTRGYYVDKEYIGVGGQNLFHEGATTTGTVDNIGTHGSGSVYFSPSAAAKVLSITYVAPYSGTYTITNPNVVTSQQLYKYFTAYGTDAQFGFAVVKMGKDDTLASAERLYPNDGSDFAYIYSNDGGQDTDDDGVNDTANTVGKVTYPNQDRVFGNGLNVHLKKGEAIRFVYDASAISRSYDVATLQFRGGVITLVEKDPLDQTVLSTYATGTRYTSLLSLMDAWETYFVNHSGYDSISPTVSGSYYIRNLSLEDVDQEEILASSPWRAEYMNANGVLEQMTYISARKRTTYNSATGTESAATFTKRWMGVNSSNNQLLWSEGAPASAAGGANNNYHNATFLQPNNNYKVVAWTYTAPVDGVYLVKSPYRTVVANSVDTNAKYAIVKIVDDQTVASAARVFPTDANYTYNDADGFDQLPSAGISVTLKKGEKLAFVVDDTEATAHKWVKCYPDVALTDLTVDGEVQTVYADEFIEVDNPTATAGETVTIKVDAERAKQLEAASLVVTDNKGNRVAVTRKGFREDLGIVDQYQFVMPNGASMVTVSQTYVAEGNLNFGILGAQYRTSGGEADGIRFGTQVWCDYDAESGTHTFVDNGKTYTILSAGTLITRRTILDTLAGRAGQSAEAYMTLDQFGADETYGKYLRNIQKTSTTYYDVNNAYMEFVGGITGLGQSDYPSGTPYEWVFCGRGYVIAADEGGNVKTFYTEIYDKSINQLMGVA